MEMVHYETETVQPVHSRIGIPTHSEIAEIIVIDDVASQFAAYTTDKGSFFAQILQQNCSFSLC